LGGRRKVGLLAVAAIGAMLFNVGCASRDGGSGAGGDEPYKIGALLGLTGTYSALGTNEQKAIELFAERVNANGGINGRQVEIVFADTKSSESEAVNQLRKLATQDDVIAVIGPSSSGEGIAIKPIATSLKVPTIVPASSKDIVTPLDQAKYVFKQFPATDASLQAQLTYVKEQGWRRVAILAANNGYGQEPVNALPNIIGDFGVELVASELFPPDATDVTAQLSSIASKNPDVVLVWAVNPANAIVAKSAENLNFEPVLFNSPGAASQDYIEVGGSAVNNTLVQGSMVQVPDEITPDNPQYEAVTQFMEAWRSRYDDAPNQYAANGWDCMLLLQAALEKGNVSPDNVTEARDKLRESLENNIKDVAGINAIYTFSPNQHGNEGIKGLAVLEVDSGAWKLLQAY